MNSLLSQLLIIIEQGLLYLPLVLGGYLVISLMQIPDLSIESAVLIGAIAGNAGACVFSAAGLGLYVGIVVAGFAGAAVGVGAALLHVYGRLSHLLSSIIMLGFCQGLSLLFMGASHRPVVHEVIKLMLVPGYPVLPILVGCGFLVSLLMCYFLKTKLGLICAFYGDNPRFLVNHRISSAYVVCMGMGIANALAGITGFLLGQVNGFIDVGMSFGTPLVCITALVLGQLLTSVKKVLAVVVPLVGVFAYFASQTILLKSGIDLRFFQLMQAVFLVIVFLSRRSRYQHTLGV